MNEFSLTAKYQDDTTVVLRWSSPSGLKSEPSYEIWEASSPAGPFFLKQKLNTGTRHYTIFNVTPVTHYYLIRTSIYKPNTNQKFESNVVVVSPRVITTVADRTVLVGLLGQENRVSSDENLVTWEPVNIDLLSMLGVYGYDNDTNLQGVEILTLLMKSNTEGIDFEYCPDLQQLSAPNLTSITSSAYVYMYGNDVLTTVNFSSLTKFDSQNEMFIGYNSELTTINMSSLVSGSRMIFENNLIQEISFPSLQYLNNDLSLSNNHLSEATVNAILAMMVGMNGGTWANSLYLNGGSGEIDNANPTGQGLLDVVTLRNRGATVFVNGEG